MFAIEGNAAFVEAESRHSTSQSLAAAAVISQQSDTAAVCDALMLRPASEMHHLTISNNLYTSKHQEANLDTTYTTDGQSSFSNPGTNDNTNHTHSPGVLSPDSYRSNVYVCTKDGCALQFSSLSESQKHNDERHQIFPVPVEYHSFYVLHSSISRYGFYKSARRFYCRLCSTEKEFETGCMLRDHAQKQHPWIALPEDIDRVPDVTLACSGSLPDVPVASRCSSHSTVVGELTGREHSDDGNPVHNVKKRGKTGHLDWEAHRGVLSELYMTEDHSLEQVMEHMSSIYDFHAKMRAYKERFKLWGFDKNVPARDMGIIVALVEKRKREDGKDSQVFFRGRLIKPMKMERFKRRKMVQEEIGETVALPGHIRCETPPVEPSTSDNHQTDDFSSRALNSNSPWRSVKDLADATLNDYLALNGGMSTSKSKFSGECDGQELVGHTRALISRASAHETRDDYKGAERLYRRVLKLPDTQKDSIAVFDSLRAVVRMRMKTDELEAALPELERLVGGCLCLFGPEHETYTTIALELAVKYHLAGRPLEGNVLIVRLLATYEASPAGKISEDSCSFLLTRASRWNPDVVESPLFNAVYWRLIEQYEQSRNWEDSLTLTLDIVDLLQDASSEEIIHAKTIESYLRRAYSLYTRHEKHGRYAHCHKLLNCTLVHLDKSGGSWMHKILVLFDVLQNDLTSQYFSAVPIEHQQKPATKLMRCYEALSQPVRIVLLGSEIRIRSALAKHWSPLDWEVLIEELRTYAHELQEKTPNSPTIKELLSLAREFETAKHLME